MCVKPISFTYGIKPLGELAVGQVAVVLLGHARPRSEVDFVDAQRALQPGVRPLARCVIHSSSCHV